MDITIEAQKILSCVKRMDERFGIGMVVDVLKGSRNERLMKAGLQNLSTYGIMQDASARRIREMIQFLSFHNFLQSKGDEYPVLQLGVKAKEILIERKALMMKVVKEQKQTIKQSKQEGVVNPSLLEALRKLRAQLAKQQHVPAYIIFNDAALLEMCRMMPKTKDDFLLINGVGAAKLKRYGTAFMDVICKYEQEKKEG